MTSGTFSDPSQSPTVSEVQCTGSETDLLSCYHSNFIDSSNCDVSTDAGVICQGTYIDYILYIISVYRNLEWEKIFTI